MIPRVKCLISLSSARQAFTQYLVKIRLSPQFTADIVLCIVQMVETRGFGPSYQNTIEKVFSKVLPFVHDGGPFGTVPELLFEKKQLIPPVQQLLAAGPCPPA